LKKVVVEDIDRDSAAYAAVMKAYKMPKVRTEKEGTAKRDSGGLKEAARVPLEVAEMGIRSLSLAESC
jgi:formiminotetrahydrofolate cyclodeaminase